MDYLHIILNHSVIYTPVSLPAHSPARCSCATLCGRSAQQRSRRAARTAATAGRSAAFAVRVERVVDNPLLRGCSRPAGPPGPGAAASGTRAAWTRAAPDSPRTPRSSRAGNETGDQVDVLNSLQPVVQTTTFLICGNIFTRNPFLQLPIFFFLSAYPIY